MNYLSVEYMTLTHGVFCSASFLAHLSRRLIDELRSGVRLSSVRRCRPSSFTMLKDLLLRNRLTDKSQTLCGASLGRGTKVCSWHLGHMTKMAATPIYGKNPSKINLLLQNRRADFHEIWYVASGTPAHHGLFK